MRPRNIAIATGILVAAGMVSPAAFATGQNTLYVSEANSACTDSGTGTYDAPYCTIQAAADVASPGDVVSIGRGTYGENVTMTRSGTAAAPITFTGSATIVETTAFTFDDASYVSLNGMRIDGGSAGAVVVNGGSNITLGGDTLVSHAATGPVLHVTGAAADVTVERSNLQGSTGGEQILVDGGSTRTVISTNLFDSAGQPVVVSDASGTDITSNTIGDACGIAVENNSVDTTVENNVVYYLPGFLSCPTPADSNVGLLVDSSSSAATTADYNDFYPGTYEWGGTSYATEAAFHAATGQGQHDIDSQTGVNLAESSPMINSANSSAPGELTTDYNNNARVVDPLVPETGAGIYAYYDRGAVQFQDPVSITQSTFTASAKQAPVGGSITLTATAQDTWKDALTYEFVPGASGGVVPPAPVTSSTGTATISFGTATDYSVDAVALVKGLTESNVIGVLQINVVAAASLTPALGVTAEGATSVTASAAGSTDSWNVTGYSFNFGDGTPAVSSGTDNASHNYAKPGTYPVTVTETDAGGNTATASSSITTNTSPPGTLLQLTRTSSGFWGTGPLNIPPGSTGIAQAAVTGMPDGSTQVAAVTTGGVLEVDVLSASGTWQGWKAVSQPGVTVKSVSIAGMPNGSSQIIEVTSAGVLKHIVRNANGTWQVSGWGSPAGSTGIAQAAITALPNGSSQLVAVTTAGTVLHNIRFATGAWQGWRILSQPSVTVKSVRIAGMPNGSSQIIEVTSAGVLKHNVRNANGTWQSSGWGSPAGSTGIAQAAITALPNGSTVLSAILANGGVKTTQRNSNGSWQVWGTFNPTYLPDAVSADLAGLPNGTVQMMAVAGP